MLCKTDVKANGNKTVFPPYFNKKFFFLFTFYCILIFFFLYLVHLDIMTCQKIFPILNIDQLGNTSS